VVYYYIKRCSECFYKSYCSGFDFLCVEKNIIADDLSVYDD
jgi:hypothetical protein